MSDTKWAKLVESGDIENLKVEDLKAYLKEKKQPMSGEKGTLLARIRLHVRTRSLTTDLGDGITDPFMLPLPALRKACGRFGASPIGDRDEMLRELVAKLPSPAAEAGTAGGAGTTGTGGSGTGGGVDAVAIARKVIELAETENHEGILSLLSDAALSRASPTAALRRAYLSLSALIHPDKLSRRFDGATKAFQALVAAYEALSAPLQPAEAEGTKRKASAVGVRVTRSNEGCYRTVVKCPRCRQEWGLPISGLPPSSYTILMQGLKSFCCDTCLLSFGCVTALHECPHCTALFEYHPNDYHRKIDCGSCGKPFGFWLHVISERQQQELVSDLRAEQERWQRRREQTAGRGARAARNTVYKVAGGADGGADAASIEEGSFRKGLLSECPRCGAGGFERTRDQAEHLEGCTDAAAHRAHKRRRKEAAAAAAARAARSGAEEAAQSRAAWEFLGSKTGDLWRLAPAALRQLALESGVSVPGPSEAAGPEDAAGEAAELVAAIAKQRRRAAAAAGGLLLTDGARGSTRGGAPEPGDPLDGCLPENVRAASDAQLRAVCAAHGIKPKGGLRLASRADLVRAIEKEQFRGRGEGEVFLLE